MIINQFPFPHFIIDNFLTDDLANKLSDEFPDFDSPDWYDYNNPIEVKKAINNWYNFPKETYSFFHYLNSSDFVDGLQDLTKEVLYPDLGLHGGGWHIHSRGGKLNVHLDYSIHPKLNLERKYNLIIYLSKDWDPAWGGNLEFWTHDEETNGPKEKTATVDCIFNRAVLFDTSLNSWHGFNDPINCPEGVYRKSIATYYLKEPSQNNPQRKRALFSPSEEQKNDDAVLNFIQNRVKL